MIDSKLHFQSIPRLFATHCKRSSVVDQRVDSREAHHHLSAEGPNCLKRGEVSHHSFRLRLWNRRPDLLDGGIASPATATVKNHATPRSSNSDCCGQPYTACCPGDYDRTDLLESFVLLHTIRGSMN